MVEHQYTISNIIEIAKIFFAVFAPTLPELFFMICWIIFVLTMINGSTILPLIFNYKIIPNIEKKVGQKLEYWSMWQRIPFWKFTCPYIEVSQYICCKYLTKKTKINFAIFIPGDYALKKVNYDIRKASRFEIVMSFIGVLNWSLSFICALTGVLIANYYNIH